jgi:hypothetical protein
MINKVKFDVPDDAIADLEILTTKILLNDYKAF